MSINTRRYHNQIYDFCISPSYERAKFQCSFLGGEMAMNVNYSRHSIGGSCGAGGMGNWNPEIWMPITQGKSTPGNSKDDFDWIDDRHTEHFGEIPPLAYVGTQRFASSTVCDIQRK